MGTSVIGEFRGCCNGSVKTPIMFPHPFTARYIRLSPVTWHKMPAMRAAVLALDVSAGEHWTCLHCTFSNNETRDNCVMCDSARQDMSQCSNSEKRAEELRALVVDAADLLVECRSVLAWTYVWAYF